MRLPPFEKHMIAEHLALSPAQKGYILGECPLMPANVRSCPLTRDRILAHDAREDQIADRVKGFKLTPSQCLRSTETSDRREK